MNSKLLDVFDGFERSVVSINDVLLGIKNIILNWSQIDTRIVNFSGPDLVSRQQIVLALAQEKFQNCSINLQMRQNHFGWVGQKN